MRDSTESTRVPVRGRGLPIHAIVMAWILCTHAAPAVQLEPPAYAAIASGPARCIPLQDRPFWFTLGGGTGSAPHMRTLEKAPLADPEPAQCGVGEWGYSFHNLKNGEPDGAGYRHFGGYPTPPQTRAEALDCVRRYYLHLREDAMAKATAEQRACFVSVNGHYCYQHYACEWGCDVVGSEVGENINSIQAHIAFTRGAARQYGKPWLIDFSSWYGPSMFDENPNRTWGDNSGPTHGHSLSLHARTYYLSYMAGANVVVAEGGWLNCFKSQEPGPDGTLPLSSLGEKAAEFYRFTRRHPDRGVACAPVALLLPFDHGIYPGFGRKLSWNAFPYTPGDQRILDALNVLFPGSLGDPNQPERPDRQPGNPAWKDPEYMHTEALRLVASPCGDIADVLLANAPADVLRSYPVLVTVGDFTADGGLSQRLDQYVSDGGTLLLDAADRATGLLPKELAERLVVSEPNGNTRIQHGKGEVYVLDSSSPKQPTAERPLAKALAAVTHDLIPFTVSGRVETLYNRTETGWIITVVNNEGITKTFREPPGIDAAAEQTITIEGCGRQKVERAVLWGADADTELDPTHITFRVPPGELRVVCMSLNAASGG